MIRRFSSRLQKLDASFINERLKGAVSYMTVPDIIDKSHKI